MRWFLSGFTPREKWALVPVVVLLLAGALLAPPAHERVVDGQVVREMVLFGYIIPKWLFMAVGAPIAALLWWGCRLLIDRIWPENKGAFGSTKFEYEKAYPREGGGQVYWKPDVPGTSSPMDYESPLFSKQTTALEFLSAPEPNAMRFLIIGDAASKEINDFHELKDGWVSKAPEATLRDLIPVAEMIFAAERGELQTAVAHDLTRSNQFRGIPSNDELMALADRVGHEEISEILRDYLREP